MLAGAGNLERKSLPDLSTQGPHFRGQLHDPSPVHETITRRKRELPFSCGDVPRLLTRLSTRPSAIAVAPTLQRPPNARTQSVGITIHLHARLHEGGKKKRRRKEKEKSKTHPVLHLPVLSGFGQSPVTLLQGPHNVWDCGREGGQGDSGEIKGLVGAKSVPRLNRWGCI